MESSAEGEGLAFEGDRQPGRASMAHGVHECLRVLCIQIQVMIRVPVSMLFCFFFQLNDDREPKSLKFKILKFIFLKF